jgi:hypothetical protein
MGFLLLAIVFSTSLAFDFIFVLSDSGLCILLSRDL